MLREVAFEKLLRREHERVQRERARRIEPNRSDDTTPWGRFMQWADTFQGKDLRVRKAPDALADDP